jgi:hypothetical protein
MLTVLHGDNQQLSRQKLNQLLGSFSNHQILRLEGKEITKEKVDQFLNYQSLYSEPKFLVLDRFFSLNKSQIESILPILNSSTDQIIIWHDKKLTALQLKLLPKAKTQHFALDNVLFKCLYAIKPRNHRQLLPLLHEVFQTNPPELFLFLLKAHLRRQLITSSRFDVSLLKKTYLQLIELDYLNKTGKLTISKELAIERTILNLIS